MSVLCMLQAFFPWYFKPEDGLAEDEFALIKSLSSGGFVYRYLRYIQCSTH